MGLSSTRVSGPIVGPAATSLVRRFTTIQTAVSEPDPVLADPVLRNGAALHAIVLCPFVVARNSDIDPVPVASFWHAVDCCTTSRPQRCWFARLLHHRISQRGVRLWTGSAWFDAGSGRDVGQKLEAQPTTWADGNKSRGHVVA